MIKTPVLRGIESSFEDTWNTCDIIDLDKTFIAQAADYETADELVNIINHQEALIKSLRDMVEIVGSNFCSSVEVKRKYKIARELLETLK